MTNPPERFPAINTAREGRQHIVEPSPNHTGYCPIIDGKAVGRYMHYEAAARISNIIVPYKLLGKFGY